MNQEVSKIIIRISVNEIPRSKMHRSLLCDSASHLLTLRFNGILGSLSVEEIERVRLLGNNISCMLHDGAKGDLQPQGGHL